ncbi:hypothetical protein J3B00_000146 [Pseudomonas sp. BP8]|nr:hypothetical protein [Pseudomonas sp. BP8]
MTALAKNRSFPAKSTVREASTLGAFTDSEGLVTFARHSGCCSLLAPLAHGFAGLFFLGFFRVFPGWRGGWAACRVWAYPFDGVGFLAPSALTAGHFLANAPKSNQKGLGSVIRPSAALRVPSLRSCSGRTALYGPSWASALSGHPWPPPPCARPPLGLLKSLVDQEPDQGQQPGQRQANRCALALFVYERICGVAGRAAPCDLHWQYRPLRGTSPLLQGLRKF